MSRRTILWIATSALLVIVPVSVAYLSQGHKPQGDGAFVAAQYVTATPNATNATATAAAVACNALPWTTQTDWINLRGAANITIDSLCDSADEVAVAQVIAIGPGRFDTTNSIVPTAEPERDDTTENQGLRVYRMVVFDVITRYEGDSSVDGYVVVQWGGSPDICPSFTYTRNPDKARATTNARGMLFLKDLPSRWISNPDPWLTYAQQYTTNLNAGGDNYQLMTLSDWFKYDTGAGTAESTWLEREMTITDLVDEVEASYP